ncbi:MAG TPA: ribosome silencing factor [Thermomicrobiales bacterium]|nr:ribosome silencing factor [Thermomicrobiales bacterium]
MTARSASIDTPIAEPQPDRPTQSEPPTPDPGRPVALQIAQTLADTPASNTVVLDIHGMSPFADYFVICSADNERQLRAINRQVMDGMAKEGIRPERTEGTPAGGWIVLDYGDVIVHIFAAELRAFYRLEDLWADAQTLVTIQ